MENILKDRRVLIIDDYPEMRSMIKQMLLPLQVGEIDMVGNGKDAIALLKLNSYNIILCDYNLGEGKNGQQVLEEAQKTSLISYSTIFIIITAESSKEIVISAAESEPDDYLSKPFNRELLRKRLERIALRKNNLAPISKWVSRFNYSNAIKTCDALITTSPKNLNQIKHIKADLYKQIGDMEAADKVYTEVISQNRLPWAEFGHGIILFKQKQYEEAKKVFNSLIKSHPTYTTAYDWLAKIAENQNHLDEAKTWLTKAAAIAPNIVQRQKQLGLVSYKDGDLETAGNALTKVVKLARNSIHENGENEANLANVYLEKGDSVQALKLINSAKKHYRSKPESQIQLALSENKIQKSLGNSDLAKSALKEATKLFNGMNNSASIDVAVKLSSALIKNGDIKTGTAMLQDVARDNHHNQDVIDKVQHVFNENNISDEGRAVITSISKSIADLNNKGVSLAKEGNLSEAKKLFKTALEEMPNNITIHLNNIQVYLMEMKKNNLSTKDQIALNNSIKLIRELEPNNPSFNRLMSLFNQEQDK